MLASCLVLLLVPVVTSFFGNQILKIASPCDGPVWMWVPQLTPAAWLIHCSLSSHSHFILPCLDIWWRRWMECERGWLDSGYYNASVSAFSLAGGIHLILPWMMWLRLPSPPPHSWQPQQHPCTKHCAVCVPGRVSALHREERISAATQLICIHIPREAHERCGLHLFCIKAGTPLTVAPLHLLSLLKRGFIKDYCFCSVGL